MTEKIYARSNNAPEAYCHERKTDHLEGGVYGHRFTHSDKPITRTQIIIVQYDCCKIYPTIQCWESIVIPLGIFLEMSVAPSDTNAGVTQADFDLWLPLSLAEEIKMKK